MTITYNLIQTVTVGSGGASTITFSSIPQTYTDLEFVVSGRATTDNPTLQIFINNDQTSANYSFKLAEGNGSAASGAAASQPWLMRITPSSASASQFSNGKMYIPRYTGSVYKTIIADSVTENDGTTAYAALHVGVWLSNTAITSIVLDPYGTNFAEFSSASLYGILNT